MSLLENEILSLCRDNALLLPGDRLVLGVSGGSDSMALLHVLAKITTPLRISMVVAHVDHGLRPEEAGREEHLVQSAAAELGFECLVAHLEVALRAKRDGSSLEEAARDLRYEFFEQVAKSHGASKIVVAHTADDQAEEILLRLIRGSGKKGLSGMALLREGRIVRPFLTTEKARILSYLHERQIVFAEDSSNADRRYLRNKIRLDLLPFLVQFNPNIKRTLRQTAAILRDEEVVLDAMVEEEYARLVHDEGGGQGPRLVVSRREFNQRPIAIRRRLVEKIFHFFEADLGYRQIDGLLTLATAEKAGQMHLEQGLRASTRQQELCFSYPDGKRAGRQKKGDAAASYQILVPQAGCYVIAEIGCEVIVELMDVLPSQEELRCGDADYLDVSAAPFPIILRNRLPGDRFWPMSSKGRKKVADFLIDRKVPLAQRDKMPIVLSRDRIVAVLGGRIDQQAMVTDQTTAVLRISMRVR